MSLIHPSIRFEIYSINDLEHHYKTKTKGHWFSKDTMSFFNSRLADTLLYTQDSVLFFSSEKGPSENRMYSIREYFPSTGNIEAIGLGFQGYKTLAAAMLAAKKLGGYK